MFSFFSILVKVCPPRQGEYLHRCSKHTTARTVENVARTKRRRADSTPEVPQNREEIFLFCSRGTTSTTRSERLKPDAASSGISHVTPLFSSSPPLLKGEMMVSQQHVRWVFTLWATTYHGRWLKSVHVGNRCTLLQCVCYNVFVHLEINRWGSADPFGAS